MTTPRIEENEYTSHEDLKEWEAEKDQNTLTRNIVALLGIHGMHCKFYEYQDVSHITKAFKTLIEEALTQAHQAGRDEAVEDKRKLLEDFADFAHTRYLGTDGKEYAYSQEVIYMIDDYLAAKALQDNK